jgi:hypothetical protein
MYLSNFIFPQVKISHVKKCNNCAFILELGADSNSYFKVVNLDNKSNRYIMD